MPVPLGDSKAMKDAAAVRLRIHEAIKPSGESDPRLMQGQVPLVAEQQMRHLEFCVQALIDEIRGLRAKDHLQKMQAFEDYARSQSDPPKAVGLK